jgi:hypothetical protein
MARHAAFQHYLEESAERILFQELGGLITFKTKTLT